MIRLKKFCFVLSVLYVLFSTSFVLASCKKPLSVGWEYWPPYQYVNTERALVGLDIELASAVAEVAQCKIKFYEIPWKRHLLEIEQGRIDVALAASYDEERAEYANFSDPVRNESVSLFILPDNKKYHKNSNLEDLLKNKFKLGVTLGYHYGKAFDALMKNETYVKHIEETHTDQLNFMKLFRGRLDGILADPISVPYQLSLMHEARQLTRAFDIYKADVHFMFSKKSVSRDTLDLFNQALKQIKSNGVYDEILGRY